MMAADKMKRAVMRWITAAILLAGISGCVSPLSPVESAADVGPGEVIVVGRVEVFPPLDDKDQSLENIGSGHLKNKLYVITDTSWREKHGPVGMSDEYFETVLGEPFYVKSDNKPFYLLESIIYTMSTGRTLEYVELPGGVKVEVHKGDKAVYIGTIRYVRNEYWDITKSQIIDDYDRANSAFKKKFGAKYTLRKALVMPIKIKESKENS